MANVITGNPWILDTTGVAPLMAVNTFVDHFEFVDYALETDTCEIFDAAGRSVWKANGAADLQEVRSGKVGVVYGGLYLQQLSAGKVRVYLSKH